MSDDPRDPIEYEQRTGKRVFVNNADLGLRIADGIPGLRIGVSPHIPVDTALVVNFDELFKLPDVRFDS